MGDTHTHNQDVGVTKLESGGSEHNKTLSTNSTGTISASVGGQVSTSTPNKGGGGKSPVSGSITGTVRSGSSVVDAKLMRQQLKQEIKYLRKQEIVQLTQINYLLLYPMVINIINKVKSVVRIQEPVVIRTRLQNYNQHKSLQ